MFCKKCGAKIADDSAFCDECGARIEKAAVNTTAVPAVPVNAAVAKKSPVKLIVIIAVVVILLAGGAIAAWQFLANTPAARADESLNAGAKYLISMDYEHAIIEFDKVLAIDPKNVEAYLGKADALASLGRTDEAEKVLENAYELTGDEKVFDKISKSAAAYSVRTTSADITTSAAVTTSADITTTAAKTTAAATTTTPPVTGYEYTVRGTKVIITKYSGDETACEIPSEIDGKPVTAIGDNAFSYCSKLTSVVIPSGVTSIGEYAFAYCSGITSVKIPTSVARIGETAFWYCTALTSVTYKGASFDFAHINSLYEAVNGRAVTTTTAATTTTVATTTTTAATTTAPVTTTTTSTTKEEEKYVLYETTGYAFVTISKIYDNKYVCTGYFNGVDATYTVMLDDAKINGTFSVGSYIEVAYTKMYLKGDSKILLYASNIYEGAGAMAKPVIYLYPTETIEVDVKLYLNGELNTTYPEYDESKNGWTVTAEPDGTLWLDGNEYSYLFWEGAGKADFQLTKGFCVKGSDTAEFLREKLAFLGLTAKEYNEFIVYWLPLMQENEYNIINFQTDAYTDSAVLEVSPKPDSMLRVFMTYQAVSEYIEIEPQILTPTQRIGFTVVEWGGTEIE